MRLSSRVVIGRGWCADGEVAQRGFGGGVAARGFLGQVFEDFLGQVQRVELGHGGQDAVHEHPTGVSSMFSVTETRLMFGIP